jgi:hypothetical protein
MLLKVFRALFDIAEIVGIVIVELATPLKARTAQSFGPTLHSRRENIDSGIRIVQSSNRKRRKRVQRPVTHDDSSTVAPHSGIRIIFASGPKRRRQRGKTKIQIVK